jgi:hypothetical protein
LEQGIKLDERLRDRAVLPGGKLLESDRQELLTILINGKINFLGELSELEMLEPVNLVTNFYGRVEESAADYTCESARTEWRSLKEYIELQLDCRLFLFIPAAEAESYKNENVLTKPARDAFPSAYAELIEAGNCYAAGRSDACVFHAMRSLERPIKALAKKLRAKLSKRPEAATWGEFLSAIDNNLKALSNAKRSTKRDAKLNFYSEARTEFSCFKDAWRNFVMHGREHYKAEKAKAILDHTCDFVERLVQEGLKE